VWSRRIKELLAMSTIGDGVLALIVPSSHASLWLFGPRSMRKLNRWFLKNPTYTRLGGVAQIGLGIWLALRQYEDTPQRWYQRWFSQNRLVVWLAPVGLLVVILLTTIYWRSRRKAARKKGKPVSIARVTELSATSDRSFEDAVNQGIQRATSTLRNVESAWIKDMNVMIENNNITAYQVNMAITFVLEDSEQIG
jgi:flavin-binding protein dodecin